MRYSGVDSPLGYKGCGRPARGNGGLRRLCVCSPVAHTYHEEKRVITANRKEL